MKKDEVEAMKWYRLTAAQNYADAQYNLGNISRRARREEGLRVGCGAVLLAAAQNYPSAQFALGRMYVTGRGVKQDEAEAVRWYTRAKDGGYPDA